ncbi:MAG: hypothetical protein K9N07_02115 [Candidatus Cloacimonetes bacterium]|nr:hypothetical protein [Candidatus Cloacimonadota bacterium]
MKNNIWIKLIVVLLAIFFWFHQILIKQHTINVNIPLKLLATPENLVLDYPRLPNITANITALGKDILVFNLSKKYFLVDAANFRYGKNPIDLVEDQLDYSENIKLQVNSILTPDDFYINMDKLVERQKLLEVQYKSVNDEEFFIKNKIKDPNRKVTVKGPLALINKIDHIKTKEISNKMIVDGKITIELVSPDAKIELEQNVVEFEITNTKIVQRTISLIPIKYPEDKNISIIPQKVSVMVSGPKEIVEELNVNSIMATLNTSNLNKDFTNVTFKLPTGIKILEYTPQNIQIIRNE